MQAIRFSDIDSIDIRYHEDGFGHGFCTMYIRGEVGRL